MRLAWAVCGVLLSGCMAANPVRPVLTCAGECTYYGPQQPDPRVEMARVLTGGVTRVAGIFVAGDVLKALGSGSGSSTVTNNNTTRESSTSVTDRSDTSVSDTSFISSTSVSDVSVSDTSAISDTSSISTSVSTGVLP